MTPAFVKLTDGAGDTCIVSLNDVVAFIKAENCERTIITIRQSEFLETINVKETVEDIWAMIKGRMYTV